MPVAPHPRASFRGVVTCARAASMLVAQRDLLVSWGHSEIADGIWLTQGSYRLWSIYSGPTHCGCGVIDVANTHRVTGREWTAAEWELIERSGRAVGFAAFHRTPAQGNWPHHCHQVAGHCQDLDPSADDQWTDYQNGYNALSGKSRTRDYGSRDYVGTTWESYQTHQQEGPDMLPDERNALMSMWKAVFFGGGDAGEQSMIARLAEIQQGVKLPGLTPEQANQLASTWKAVFFGGGDAGPKSMITRLTELQTAVGQVLDELAASK